VHVFPVRVYYSDTDCSGIVYHARYLDFAEHARTEMFRSVGGGQQELLEQQICFVVKSIAIEFNLPGKLDDLLSVESQIAEAKHFSLTLSQKVKRGEETLAVLSVRIACLNAETLRPLPLPQDLLSAMQAL
jgi:acyl-CoA thioester hydrolase